MLYHHTNPNITEVTCLKTGGIILVEENKAKTTCSFIDSLPYSENLGTLDFTNFNDTQLIKYAELKFVYSQVNEPFYKVRKRVLGDEGSFEVYNSSYPNLEEEVTTTLLNDKFVVERVVVVPIEI